MWDETKRRSPLAILLDRVNVGDAIWQEHVNATIVYKEPDAPRFQYRVTLDWLDDILSATPAGAWREELLLEKHRLELAHDEGGW